MRNKTEQERKEQLKKALKIEGYQTIISLHLCDMNIISSENLNQLIINAKVLKNLDLSYNKLTRLPPLPLHPISKLLIQGNRISEWKQNWHCYVQIQGQMDISHNLLTGIHKMAKMKDLGMNFLAIHENKDIDFRQFDAYQKFKGMETFWYY